VRQSLTLAGRDVQAIIGSAFGTGLLAGFAALAGALLVLQMRAGQARLDEWFAELFVAVGLLAALVTMRALAEEERAGALELLLTEPLRAWQVVAGKSLAALGVVVLAAAATAGCPLLLAALGNPDPGPIITGYAGLGLAAAAFVSVGTAVSAATGSPLVAAAGTAAVLGGSWSAGLVGRGLGGRPKAWLDYLSPANHVVGFLRGTLALADIAFYVSACALGLTVAVAVLRWRR